MDKYFSVNAFLFLIFFDLLTFNNRVLNLAGSLARNESHLLCVTRHVIGCSPLMSHIHVHALHKLISSVLTLIVSSSNLLFFTGRG